MQSHKTDPSIFYCWLEGTHQETGKKAAKAPNSASERLTKASVKVSYARHSVLRKSYRHEKLKEGVCHIYFLLYFFLWLIKS